MYMFKYILKRLGLMLMTFCIIMLICFVLIKLLPIPINASLGSDRELIEANLRARGYYDPIMVQLWNYVKRIVTEGDFGIGVNMPGYINQPVWDAFVTRLPPTVLINVYSTIIGVAIGLGAHRTAGHVHYRQKRENLGYMGRLCYAQNMSAVTGACLLVKKALYEEAGGLDESFAVSLNDVDFCLKLRKLGYLNVFTPFAEAYHYESASRGSDLTGEAARRYNEESARFREKWKDVLEAGDPYYNPNFSLDKSDFSLRV